MNRRRRTRRYKRTETAEALEIEDLDCFDEDGRLRPLCLICHEYVYPGDTVIQMTRMEVTVGKKSGCTNYEQVYYPDGDEEKIIHEACFASELGFMANKINDPPGSRDI